MISNDFVSLVGNTPCVQYKPYEAIDAKIFIKLEGQNPSGSVKDRACIYSILSAINDGRLNTENTLLDASSGNMACSLAYFGAILGYKVEVICSSKLTKDKAAFIRYFGAKLHRVGDFTIEGNRHCHELIKRQKTNNYLFLDQLHNWNNPRAHFETTGPEILSDFQHPAAVVVSLGSGGTLNGIARYIREKSPLTKVVSVESASGTKLPGVGAFLDGDYVTPFIKQLDEKHLIDERIQVTKARVESRSACIKSQGFFCGLQTAAVVEAAVQFAQQYKTTGDIVVISGDSGWKNMDKLSVL